MSDKGETAETLATWAKVGLSLAGLYGSYVIFKAISDPLSALRNMPSQKWRENIEMIKEIPVVGTVTRPLTFPYEVLQGTADRIAGEYVNATTKIDSLSGLVRVSASDVFEGLAIGVPTGVIVGTTTWAVRMIQMRPIIAIVDGTSLGAGSAVIVTTALAGSCMFRDVIRFYNESESAGQATIQLGTGGIGMALGYFVEAKLGLFPIVETMVAAMFETILQVGFVGPDHGHEITDLVGPDIRHMLKELPSPGDRVGFVGSLGEQQEFLMTFASQVPVWLVTLFSKSQLVGKVATSLLVRRDWIKSMMHIGKLAPRVGLTIPENLVVYAIIGGANILLGYVISWGFGWTLLGKSEYKEEVIRVANQTVGNQTGIYIPDQGITNDTVSGWFAVSVSVIATMLALAFGLHFARSKKVIAPPIGSSRLRPPSQL